MLQRFDSSSLAGAIVGSCKKKESIHVIWKKYVSSYNDRIFPFIDSNEVETRTLNIFYDVDIGSRATLKYFR